MKEVKIGFIGVGPRAQGLIRYSIKPVKNIIITALCDKFEPLITKTLTDNPDLQAQPYTDHHQMLKEADIDAVYVCVGPKDNPALVCDALAAGKHTICDVPLAFDSVDDCWQVVLAVENSGLKFEMAEQVRYAPYAQAWKTMVQQGQLGKIAYAEGEYLHGMTKDRFWLHPETGRRLTIEQAKKHPNAVKSRAWTLVHPIRYLPHELSPILNILQDRVTSVSCMGTRPQSYVYDFLPTPDLEVALMHTQKDTVLKMAAGFNIRTIWRDSDGYHWKRIIGTKGTVELNRANSDQGKMYLAETMSDSKPAQINWDFDPHDTPSEMLESGHGGLDCYPVMDFVTSILNDTTPACDVYQTCDITAPAIIAGMSAEQGGVLLPVPDFRPGPNRKPGQMPQS